MPNLARTWSNRTLRIRQRALVETACRGEAYALQVLPQAFRGPVPILSLRSVSGEVLRIFLVCNYNLSAQKSRQEDLEFMASLGYTGRHCFKEK